MTDDGAQRCPIRSCSEAGLQLFAGLCREHYARKHEDAPADPRVEAIELFGVELAGVRGQLEFYAGAPHLAPHCSATIARLKRAATAYELAIGALQREQRVAAAHESEVAATI